MAQVGIVMGSDSDMPIMSKAADILEELGISYEMRIISAHREPDVFFDYAKTAEEKGFKVIIAGMAAHLPGMCAAIFPMPVIGIPMHTTSLGGRDSLYSIVQMPSGIPVATVAICLGKSTIAGFVSGIVAHKLSSKNMTLSVILAALLTPVCNTGVFVLGVSLFFLDLIQSWAGDQAVGSFIVFGLVGVNFLFEVLFDIILAPIIIRIIQAIKKSNH